MFGNHKLTQRRKGAKNDKKNFTILSRIRI